jgi:hypothetical protein
MREKPWTTLLAPLALLLPAATLAILAEEIAFAWYWSRQAAAPQRKGPQQERPQTERIDEWFRGAGGSPREVPIWP